MPESKSWEMRGAWARATVWGAELPPPPITPPETGLPTTTGPSEPCLPFKELKLRQKWNEKTQGKKQTFSTDTIILYLSQLKPNGLNRTETPLIRAWSREPDTKPSCCLRLLPRCPALWPPPRVSFHGLFMDAPTCTRAAWPARVWAGVGASWERRGGEVPVSPEYPHLMPRCMTSASQTAGPDSE